jgi:hypothetical protein
MEMNSRKIIDFQVIQVDSPWPSHLPNVINIQNYIAHRATRLGEAPRWNLKVSSAARNSSSTTDRHWTHW